MAVFMDFMANKKGSPDLLGQFLAREIGSRSIHGRFMARRIAPLASIGLLWPLKKVTLDDFLGFLGRESPDALTA